MLGIAVAFVPNSLGATPPSKTDLRTGHHSDRLRLEAGWNLLALPPGTPWSSPSRNGLSVWRVHGGSTEQARFPSQADRIGGQSTGFLLWVYTPTEHFILVGGQTNPTDLDLPEGARRLSFRCRKEDTHPAAEEALAWDPVLQAYQQVPLPESQTQGLEACHATSPLAMAPLENVDPGPVGMPENLSATTYGRTVVLTWEEPSAGVNHSPTPDGTELGYRVYRDNVPVRELTGVTRVEDEMPGPDHVYHYHVASVLLSEDGVGRESPPTQSIPVRWAPPAPIPQPGAFEAPNIVVKPDGQAILPDVALAKTEDATLAHLVYGVRANPHQKSPDHLRYHRSERAGKPGSFDVDHRFATGQGGTLAEIAVTARDALVSVAWVEVKQSDAAAPISSLDSDASSDSAWGGLAMAPERRSSQVWVAQSMDGGLSFSTPFLVRESSIWQRGLDMAYDRGLGHHLVWGEGGKVYYLKNLAGEPSNVFDVTRRSPVTEVVRYKVRVEPNENGVCDCPNCWCEESYTLGRDQKGIRYRDRTEESHVVQPALHVDDNTITIVGRQIRMWDNRPVLNDAWTAMLASPVYNQRAVRGQVLTRYLVGWQSVWKTAYEPNDEALYPSLGFAHQMLYQGTWHEQDEIKVAQRPIMAGAWTDLKPPSNSSTQPQSTAREPRGGQAQGKHTQDEWHSETQNWRVSAVAAVGEGQSDDTPSYPKITSTPVGLVLVYENGLSDDPNVSGFNPIQHQTSADGGLSWSSPETIARGYVPQVAVTQSGEMAALYYVPQGPTHGAITARRGTLSSERTMLPEEVLNTQPARPIHFRSHGDRGDALQGRAALTSHGDLLLAAWVEQDPVGAVDRVVISRASSLTEVVHYDLDLPDYLTEDKGAEVRVQALNRYHMKVDSKEPIRLARPIGERGPSTAPPYQGSDGLPPPTNTKVDGLSDAPGTKTTGHQGQAEGSIPHRSTPPLELRFQGGEAWVWVDSPQLALMDTQGVVQGELTLSPSATANNTNAPLANTKAWPHFGADVPVFERSALGNYEKARWMRDRLFHRADDETEPMAYQVEYEVAGSDSTTRTNASRWLAHNFADEDNLDTRYLARFRRVWAYTQGIALAQLAREEKRENDAIALARYLCKRAHVGTHEGAPIIKGWPFSWNTDGDNWEDARLVTGATAWVVHGLGAFLTSSALHETSKEAQLRIRECYQKALGGLAIHRLTGTTEGGLPFSLMTAGFTTQGLDLAATPSKIGGPDGKPMAQPEESWDYYDVLDALGYDRFDPEQAPKIGRTPSAQGQNPQKDGSAKVLTESEFWILKEEVRSLNVVTEHNLDVLSVLNHAIRHAEALGVDRSSLKRWRNEVRNGIFYVLYDPDETLWQRDLEDALAANQNDPEKRREIQRALFEGAWGRISTGGSAQLNENEAWTFHRSEHVAIDNCSWLSLSVDYDDLTDKRAIERLGRCLEFTTLAFAKKIAFGPKQYYGTHYFFDGFEDRYIDASDQQEQSFHLEATTGLILGLLAFAEAHPTHPKAPFFRSEAGALWSGVQDFVADHGFPYSSQRIQDLSTLLTSSTALIWFIDVYDHIEAQRQDLAPAIPWGPEQTRLWPLSRTQPGGIAVGRGLYNAFQTLLTMHPQAAAFLAPAALSLGFGLSGGVENDMALKTMVALREPPGPGWNRAGSIAADHVMHELASDSGLLVFFYPETDIRQWGRYQTPQGTTHAFDEDKIYAFDLQDLPDLLPYETIFGGGDSSTARFEVPHFKTKPANARLGVFVLDTDDSKSAVVDRFLSHHLWWDHVLQVAAFLPTDGTREAWLRTMRNMFLGWFFDARTAVLVAHNGPSKGSRPFWYKSGPSAVEGAKSPLPLDDDEKTDVPVDPSTRPHEVLPAPSTPYPPAPTRGKEGWESFSLDAKFFDELAELWTMLTIAPVQQEFKNLMDALKKYGPFHKFIESSGITITFVPEADWHDHALFKDQTDYPMHLVLKEKDSGKQTWYFLKPDRFLEERYRALNPQYSRSQNLLKFQADAFFGLVTNELFNRGILRVQKETDTSFSVPLGRTKITYETHDQELREQTQEALHELGGKKFGLFKTSVAIDPASNSGSTVRKVFHSAYPTTPGGAFGFDFVPGVIALNHVFTDHLTQFENDIRLLEEGGYPDSVKVEMVNLDSVRKVHFSLLEPARLVLATFTGKDERVKEATFLAMQDDTPNYRRFALEHRSVHGDFEVSESDGGSSKDDSPKGVYRFVELDAEDPFQRHIIRLLKEEVASTTPEPWSTSTLRDELGLKDKEVLDVFAPIPEAAYDRDRIEALIRDNLFLYHLILQSQSQAWPSNRSVRIPLRSFMVDAREGLGGAVASVYDPGDWSVKKVRTMTERHLSDSDRDAITTSFLVRGVTFHLLGMFKALEEDPFDPAEAFDHFRKDKHYNLYIQRATEVADTRLSNTESLAGRIHFSVYAAQFYAMLLEQSIHRPSHHDRPFEIDDLSEIEPEWRDTLLASPDSVIPVHLVVRPSTILLLSMWNIVPSFIAQIIRDFGYDENDDTWRSNQDQKDVRQAILDAEDEWKKSGFAATRSFDTGMHDSTSPLNKQFYMKSQSTTEETR